MGAVDIVNVSVELGGERVLRDILVCVADGELLAIVGPSGSGKTTMLRVVAGLARAAAGMVRIDGRDVTSAPPATRNVGMVFQQPALLPKQTVRRNVSFPLEVRREEVAEIRRRVDAEVRALHLEELLLKRPIHLSRGEAQLVQIARAMVRVPTVLLLDEPFAALGFELKHRMRAEIGVLQRGYGVTTLMTTNDPADVAALPDRLVVLDSGRIAQIGTTAGIHRAPTTLNAAMTTGVLATIPVTVEADRAGFWLVRDDPDGGLPLRLSASMPSLADRVGDEIVLGIRPEHVRVSIGGQLRGRVNRIVPGSPSTILCEVAGRNVWVRAPDVHPEVGDVVDIRLDRSALFDLTSGYAIT
jgi:ABC-type sugar transport system ATPase subunit